MGSNSIDRATRVRLADIARYEIACWCGWAVAYHFVPEVSAAPRLPGAPSVNSPVEGIAIADGATTVALPSGRRDA